MSTDPVAIEVEALTKRFGDVVAVDGLTFSVPRGSVTGFLGPNGAGKTTTMRVLLGLARSTSGATRVLGAPYERLERPMTRIGAALEVTGFHPGRTARNHLAIVGMEADLPAGRVDEALAKTGMAEYADRRVGGFSSGMRQRLALATALLGDPQVLILDEPANGLDPAGVAWLRGFLRSFAASGGSVLISSHILAEVAEVADRVVVINRGHLVTEGPVSVLTGSGGGVVIARTPDASRLADALRRAGASVEAGDDTLTIGGIAIERVGEIALASGTVLHELRPRAVTLEEAFLSLTEGAPEVTAIPPLIPPPPPPASGMSR
jgi:ABC-2 type transport system ATP-binding protein